MDLKKCLKIISDLAEAKPEDLSISRLQSILNLDDDPNFTPEPTSDDPLWTLSQQYLHVQQQFLTKCLIQHRPSNDDDGSDGPPEDLLNPREQVQFFVAVDRIRQFTVSLYLPKELRGLTRCELKLVVVQLEVEGRVRRLRYCLEAFRRLFQFRAVAVEKRLEYCVLEFIAGVFGLYLMKGDYSELRNDELFKSFSCFSLEAIFKSLLIIKGNPNVTLELAKQIHLELLRQTGQAGGFPVLCRTLLANVPSDETPTWKKSEIIAKIVASKGHTKTFYRQVLKDCFQFYEASLLSGDQDNLSYVGTCIECLRQMYLLPPAYEELRKTIQEFFVARFDVLAEPKELLSGSIVIERTELVTGLYLNYMAFSGSSCSSLNSSILVPYLQILLKIYSILPVELDERKHLQTLIVFCLANREKSELESLLKELLVGTDKAVTKKFHPRIYLKNVQSEESYSLQVGPGSDEDTEEDSLGSVLVEILKVSNRNLLIYDVFVILLKLFDEITSRPSANLILDPEEQDASSCKLFFRKYVLIQALTDLISHKHFHAQLYENPAEILAFIKSTLERALDTNTQSEDLLEVMLSIFQEYLRRLQTRDDVQTILKLLHRYKTSNLPSAQLRSQIEHICKDDSNQPTNPADQPDLTPYANATSLCLDREPYCKVYGTTLMIKLLKERNPETLANKHAVLILALNNLRNIESYAFLNSVRLLVALCDVLEADTLETLIKEYQCLDNEVDFRLKVGEAALKTVEAIGPIAFKYREQLVNCFLHGCRSPVDEFRASSLANLGNVCKILAYQVHNFFYEMFLVIKSTLETDRYLPARRAAILVLSQLLEGIDNLLTLEDYLLLVYRFLKHIVSTERDDEVTRLQAAVALDHMSARTKEFLKEAEAGRRMEKEIRIFGIKEEEAERRRKAAKGDDSVLIKMLD